MYVEQALGPPDATRVLSLENFSIEEDFRSKIGSGSAEVSDRSMGVEYALWVAGDMLSGLPQGAVLRVMMMTRDQAPGTLTASVKARAENIGAKGGILQLAPLVGPGDTFNTNEFWAGLLELAAPRHLPESQLGSQKRRPYALDEDDERILSVSNLSSVVRMRAYRKRAITRINWTLGPGGPTIGVKLFATSQSAWPGSKGSLSYVHSMDATPLVKVTTTLDMGTGIPLEKGQEPRRYYPKSDKEVRLPKVYASIEEIKQLKSPVSKGMSLLGFKPRAALQTWHQLRAATFCYPDEVTVSGSVRAFASLHEAMITRDVIGVCALVRGPSSEPRLVAVVPQQETREGDTGAQISPPGFHLIHLPYSDDVRWPERDPAFTGAERAVPTEAAIEAAAQLVNAFKLEEEFDPVDIPNPHLQRWFEILEKVAISQEASSAGTEAEDLAKPDALFYTQDAKALAENFIVSY